MTSSRPDLSCEPAVVVEYRRASNLGQLNLSARPGFRSSQVRVGPSVLLKGMQQQSFLQDIRLIGPWLPCPKGTRAVRKREPLLVWLQSMDRSS
jgi:hypothetical protein